MPPPSSGGMYLWNIGILPYQYTASQTRRPRLEISPSWEHENSQLCLYLWLTESTFVPDAPKNWGQRLRHLPGWTEENYENFILDSWYLSGESKLPLLPTYSVVISEVFLF